jgi:hypothetical protein
MTTHVKPLSFLMVLILFTACSTKRKEIHVTSLNDVMTNLAPTAEEFQINPAEESLLTGKKGTTVYIPPDAFQFADGTAPTTPVKIELKECYSLTDMIAENLGTMSGPRILETGGMIYFNATSDGKQLSVKDGKAFVVAFPKNNQTKEMDLFYNFTSGDTLTTWVPDYEMYQIEQAQKAGPSTLEGDSSAYEIQYPIDMTDDLFDYRLYVSQSSSTYTGEAYFNLPLKGRSGTLSNFIEDPAVVPDSISKTFYKNNWRIRCTFKIDRGGKIVNLKTEPDENTKATPYALNFIKQHLKNAPAFDLPSQSKDSYDDLEQSVVVMGYRTLNEDRFKKRFREQYSQYTEKAIQKMDRNALEFYTMSVTEMGWINCDRFWDLAAAEKTNFIVNTSLITDTKILIVFKDIKSIINPTRQKENAIFEGLPLGKQIKVIGISYENGKPTMAVAETTVDKDGFDLKDFKEFSLDDLEKELNQ